MLAATTLCADGSAVHALVTAPPQAPINSSFSALTARAGGRGCRTDRQRACTKVRYVAAQNGQGKADSLPTPSDQPWQDGALAARARRRGCRNMGDARRRLITVAGRVHALWLMTPARTSVVSCSSHVPSGSSWAASSHSCSGPGSDAGWMSTPLKPLTTSRSAAEARVVSAAQPALAARQLVPANGEKT
jgi:hypothetical protein